MTRKVGSLSTYPAPLYRKGKQKSGVLLHQHNVYSAGVIVFLHTVITGFMGSTLSEPAPAVSQVAVVYCGHEKRDKPHKTETQDD